jgi:hypothetical protein
MNEVYLYRCQICKLAVIADEDKGSVWYIVNCAGCKIGQFYEKIVIAQRENGYKGSQLYVEMYMGKEANGDTNTRTDKKE